MAQPLDSSAWRGRPAALVCAVALVVACWIVGNPRSSGPDEPSHMVSSAGLVRGHRDGPADPDRAGYVLLDVPAMVGAPDPGCWALDFSGSTPVVCANTEQLTTETQLRGTTSFNYPPWALILPGLASFSPSAGAYQYLARAFSAAIPIALVSAALLTLRRRRTVAATIALLGLTPIAWFTFGVVSPSAVAIAGGLALWAGLLFERHRGAAVLAIAGWACVLLPRRDGPVWATLIVLAVCWLTAATPGDLWRRLGRWSRVGVVALACLPMLTPLWNREFGFNLLIALAPLTLVVTELLVRWIGRIRTRRDRVLAVVGVGVVILIGIAGAVTQRPGGYSSTTTAVVLTNTGRQLQQLVGNLGWLSTPVPAIGVYLFWALIGGLAIVAALEFRHSVVVYLGMLAAAIVTAWVMELAQGASYGEYWQGRYTMPLAVGLPLVLVWRPTGNGWLVDRLASIVGWGSFVIANVAFIAAQRRWAVGVNGSRYPWDWNTWGSPITPWLLIIVHAVATAALVITACAGSLGSSRQEPAT